MTTSAIVQPVLFGNVPIGKIALSPRCAEDAEAALRLVTLVAKELGGALRVALLVEESQRLAATDPLTGLMNRRAFSDALAVELARSERRPRPLTLLLLDVDHFKMINDGRGHASGDRVLAALGKLLRKTQVRAGDLAARWGGEEFVVAYFDTPLEGAMTASERLRTAIAALQVVDDLGAPFTVTASIGLAELRPGERAEALVGRADRAMYASKAGGRNRVTADVPRRDAPDELPIESAVGVH